MDDFENVLSKNILLVQKDINNTLDFIDTAAIICCCDLVITDSMNAHLSGSLERNLAIIKVCT